MRNLLFALGVGLAGAAGAATEIELWHAMPGALGEELGALVQLFNASHTGVRVKPVYQGGYDQTYSRALAAHFDGRGPHLVQAYEAASASLLAWRGAIKPLWEVMDESGKRVETGATVAEVEAWLEGSS